MNKEQTAAELAIIQVQLNQTSFDKNYKDAVMSGVKIGLDRGWNAALEHARKDTNELRQSFLALCVGLEMEKAEDFVDKATPERSTIFGKLVAQSLKARIADGVARKTDELRQAAEALIGYLHSEFVQYGNTCYGAYVLADTELGPYIEKLQAALGKEKTLNVVAPMVASGKVSQPPIDEGQGGEE